MKRTLLAGLVLATAAFAGPVVAYAKGGGPEGAHHWLMQNKVYAAAHQPGSAAVQTAQRKAQPHKAKAASQG